MYVIRNYKDITVSMYNFMKGLKHYNYNGKWEDWLQLHLDGNSTYLYSYAQVIRLSFMYSRKCNGVHYSDYFKGRLS